MLGIAGQYAKWEWNIRWVSFILFAFYIRNKNSAREYARLHATVMGIKNADQQWDQRLVLELRCM